MVYVRKSIEGDKLMNKKLSDFIKNPDLEK
jgi:hypothetical protein